MTPHEKQLLTLRQLLIGRRFFRALMAMEVASSYHVGTRKDGVTPEFNHQVVIALFALTLPDVMFPEELITTIFLHDVREDYHVSDQEIRDLFGPGEFADRVASAVDAMTKTFRGVVRDQKALFDTMALNPIASLAKLCDRVHNLQTMVGVFSLDKQKKYISEAREFFFPMGKKARRNFPMQTAAYENIKFLMNSQIQLIEAMHVAAAQVEALRKAQYTPPAKQGMFDADKHNPMMFDIAVIDRLIAAEKGKAAAANTEVPIPPKAHRSLADMLADQSSLIQSQEREATEEAAAFDPLAALVGDPPQVPPHVKAQADRLVERIRSTPVISDTEQDRRFNEMVADIVRSSQPPTP